MSVKYPLKLKKSSNNGLFRLFSKVHPTEAKQEFHSNSDSSEDSSVAAGLRDMGLVVVPCNYIRPTGLKLEPRNETPIIPHIPGSRRGPLFGSPTRSEFNAEIKSNGPQSPTRARFQPSSSHDDNATKPIRPGLYLKINHSQVAAPLISPIRPVHETGLPAFASLRLNFVVGRISMDFQSTSMWISWLTSYSNGEFNIQNPPISPPLSSSFSHLPAVYPKNEDRRYLVSKNYELKWQDCTQERAGFWVREAIKMLGVQCGAVSFFDEEHEVFKTEIGYNTPRVQRSSSIAAHALYTTEVLAIIDIKEDWRFKNNPLVIGKPYIRFFAATPLVTPDGVIIGTLSVFSQKPQKRFSFEQRYQLLECGAALTAEIIAHCEQYQTIQYLESTKQDGYQVAEPGQIFLKDQVSFTQKDGIKNKDDKLYGEVCKRSDKAPDPEIRPPSSHRYHKLALFSKPLGKMFMRSNQSRPIIPSEHTPPSSVESSQEPTFDAVRDLAVHNEFHPSLPRPDTQSSSTSFPRYRKMNSPESIPDKLTTQAGDGVEEFSPEENMANSYVDIPSNDFSVSPITEFSPSTLTSGLHDKVIPYYYGDYLCAGPRPFSSSDLTSLNSLPPNSPNQSGINYDFSHHPNLDMTVEDFMSLSDCDITEQSDESIPSELDSLNNRPITKYTPPHPGVHQDQRLSHEAPENILKTPNLPQPRMIPRCRLPEEFLRWKFPNNSPKSPSVDLPSLDMGDDSCNDYTAPNSYKSCEDIPLRTLSNLDYTSHHSEYENYPTNPNKHQHNQSTASENEEFDQGGHFEVKPALQTCDTISFISSWDSRRISRVQSLCCGHSSSLAFSRRSMSLCQQNIQGPVSQAAIELASYSNKMGYDLMYIANVFPRSIDAPTKTESDIIASKPYGVKVQLLTAHGLSDTVHLCPLIHIRVLRNRGPMYWEDFNEKNEFKQGLLVVITAEGGPFKLRSKGLVLGAFREASSSRTVEYTDSSAEGKALTELGRKLKATLKGSTTLPFNDGL